MALTFLAPAGAFDPAAVTAVYADGGVLNRNPSEVGGTWAFCLVNAIGGRVFGQAGHVAAEEVAPLPWVSNNLTEVVALLLALENLPDGWAGAAFSDSKNAIRAHMAAADLDPRKPGYLPDELWGRMVAARQRLGAIRWTLLGGHPRNTSWRPATGPGTTSRSARTTCGPIRPAKLQARPIWPPWPRSRATTGRCADSSRRSPMTGGSCSRAAQDRRA